MQENKNIANNIFGIIFSALVILIILSLVYCVVTILTNINVDVMAKFIEKSMYTGHLKILLYFVTITIAGGVIGSILGYNGAIFLSGASKKFSILIIKTFSDFLSRFPALLTGLLTYFVLVFILDFSWGLITQIMVFAAMIAAPVYDSSSIALKNKLSPKEGFVLGFVRVWLEFFIMMIVVIFYVSEPSIRILDRDTTQGFSDFISAVCNEGLLFSHAKDFSYIIAVMVIMSIVNSLVNWFYKNYAIRCFNKK